MAVLHNVKGAPVIWIIIIILNNAFGQEDIILNSENSLPTWAAVKINPDKFLGSNVAGQENSFEITYPRQCLQTCVETQWCSVYCENDGNCRISRYILSPQYEELDTTSVTTCYTRRSSDFAVGAITYSNNNASVSYPKRKLTNLVDGLYPYHMDHCWIDMAGGYAVIDMKEQKRIKEILLYSQPNQIFDPLWKDVTVKLGNETKTVLFDAGDFSPYLRIGSLTSVPLKGAIQKLALETPILAQFVLIYNPLRNFGVQICNIEILG